MCVLAGQDGGQDSKASINGAPNNPNSHLLSSLTNQLQDIHDVDYPLTDRDNVELFRLVLSRWKSDSAASYYKWDARWRCYVRSLSSSHLIISVVPASYDDFAAIEPVLATEVSEGVETGDKGSKVDEAEDVSEGVDGKVNLVKGIVSNHRKSVEMTNGEIVLGSSAVEDGVGISAGDVERDANKVDEISASGVDLVEKICEEDVGVESVSKVVSGTPKFPVFVFDCSLSAVSDQLVRRTAGEPLAGLTHDFTLKV